MASLPYYSMVEQVAGQPTNYYVVPGSAYDDPAYKALSSKVKSKYDTTGNKAVNDYLKSKAVATGQAEYNKFQSNQYGYQPPAAAPKSAPAPSAPAPKAAPAPTSTSTQDKARKAVVVAKTVQQAVQGMKERSAPTGISARPIPPKGRSTIPSVPSQGRVSGPIPGYKGPNLRFR